MTIKALPVVMKAGDLANVVTANPKVLLAERKKNCQRRKERSELRLKEIAHVGDKLFIMPLMTEAAFQTWYLQSQGLDSLLPLPPRRVQE